MTKGLHKNSLRKGEPNKWMVEDIIEQIRSEVEREARSVMNGQSDFVAGKRFELENILSFLSTLQEQPVKTDIVEDLKHYIATTPKEQQVKDWEKLKEWGKVGPLVSEFLDRKQPVCEELEETANKFARSYDMGTCDGIAQDCFKAGANWQKEQDEEIINAVGDIPGDIEKAYNNGRKDMREQMMKEAVEGDIGMILHDKTADLFVRSKGYLPKSLGIKCNDKVRIVIVKEDKQ